MFVDVLCGKIIVQKVFASAIESHGSSCSSSVSEDESTIELLFSFSNAPISSSPTSPDVMTSSSQHSKCSISFCEKAFTPCFSAPIEKAFHLPTLAMITAKFT
ncbi:hypothetical protein AVEN_31545-1 [Araneus ventricosus]|uniref:Uncharacterized protein n=1 Tax=Araneus ventricosus TaxID=182803 RepID=A0A4Y2GQQ7_ARAVE|nr:hypothetical protein AVEN_31545-1 [Araneus ventricosus]